MKQSSECRSTRVLAASLVAGIVLIAGAVVYFAGPSSPWLPKCPLHEMTGLHCPGCGMTRATHALLHGDLPGAFRFNPLVMGLLPLGALALAFRFRIGIKTAWVLVALVIAFGVLRNLPSWPFVLLAPP